MRTHVIFQSVKEQRECVKILVAKSWGIKTRIFRVISGSDECYHSASKSGKKVCIIFEIEKYVINLVTHLAIKDNCNFFQGAKLGKLFFKFSLSGVQA